MKYRKVIHELMSLCHNDNAELLKMANEHIGKWQNLGYNVDIHYAIDNNVFTIILEKYLMEKI